MQRLKTKAQNCIAALRRAYPEAECTLNYAKDYELLFATRLAAQCTDARVNVVCAELFSVYPTLRAFSCAELSELAQLVRPTGFYHTKARDIKAAARMLIEEYGARVPDNMEDLLKIPGVGRKTANLILGDVYGKPAYVCDTHCIRITNLLGLTQGTNPEKVEAQLREVLPPDEANGFCHRLVMHGRAVCVARRQRCGECVMRDMCDFYKGAAV